jgi:hypothetical protein
VKRSLCLLLAIAALSGTLAAFAGGQTTTVTPQAYVTGVCTAIGNWVASVQDRSTALTSTNPTTPRQGKREFVTFMNEVVQDTNVALAALRAAGTPDVPDGTQIATAVIGAMQRAHRILVNARYEAQHVPVNSRSAFARATAHLGKSVQNSLSRIGSGLSSLQSPALETAAAAVPACQSL